MSNSRIKATIKISDNISENEFNDLTEGLKKINGFDFCVDSFVLLKPLGLSDKFGVKQYRN